MKKHKFWGEIQEDRAGFSAEQAYDIPHFGCMLRKIRDKI